MFIMRLLRELQTIASHHAIATFKPWVFAICSLCLLLTTHTASSEDISREEWFADVLVKLVSERICTDEELATCYEITEARCRQRVESTMFDCYSEQIEDIPKTISPETAREASAHIATCFQPKFTEDLLDYRKPLPECQANVTESAQPPPDPVDPENIEIPDLSEIEIPPELLEGLNEEIEE